MQQRAVITADVVGSRTIPEFPALRDSRLHVASDLHLARQMVLVPYTITTWDEFQTIAVSPAELPDIIFDLRRCFYPVQLRIGAGIGTIDEPAREPINEFAGGDAFLLARDALDTVGERLTRIRCQVELVQRVANLTYRLHDALLAEISPKQWEAIGAYIEGGSQEAAAVRLGVDKSTVSRTLARAHYWELVSAREELRYVLQTMTGAETSDAR